jgi:phosphate transport system protein
MTSRLHLEIERLKKQFLALGAVVEEALRQAVRSIETRDADLAQRVIDRDLEIDRMEVELEEECLKTLALHQPVATDLRFIIAILKINSDLERIGDLAVNIAEHSLYFASRPRVSYPFDFVTMTEKTKTMLQESLNALVRMDTNMAKKVCVLDDEVDAINRQMYLQVEDEMRRHPEDIEALMHFIGVSRHIERIADHATNIAEDIVYMVDGRIIRHRAEQYKPYLEKDQPS